MELTTGIVCILDSYKRPAGTGFIVSTATENLIVTCAHVLGEPKPEQVTIVLQATGEPREAKVIDQWWRSKDAEDIAILQVIGGLPKGVQPLLLGNAKGTRGHTIHTFGFPEVGEVNGVLGLGTVLGLGAKTQAGQPLLQIRSSEITSGFSGAPLYDEAQQQVIGMVIIVARPDISGKLGETAFAIPTETLRIICPALQISEKFPIHSMAKAPSPGFVRRPEEFEALKRTLLGERGESSFITVALRGTGGFGKTTLARAFCHDKQVQEAFEYGILWITLGKEPGNLIGKIEDLIYELSGKRSGFEQIDAASSHFAALLADREMLLVLDDVWDEGQLEPFLQGGLHCARLITTRNEHLLPPNTRIIPVNTMNKPQAVDLLTFGINRRMWTAKETRELYRLTSRLGEWPLLLKLVNGVLRNRVLKGESVSGAIVNIHKALNRRGLKAFDIKITQERNLAVEKTLDLSFEMLDENDKARFKELAIFPEHIEIPLVTLQRLWGKTGDFDDFTTDDLCYRLYGLSLLLDFDLEKHTILLHQVIRSYLRDDMNITAFVALHEQFLDAYSCKRWAKLPEDEPYLWKHIVYHLHIVGRNEELIRTVKDGWFLVQKICFSSTYSVESDLSIAENLTPTDNSLTLLKRSIASMSHLLNRCATLQEVGSALHSRLAHVQQLSSLCSTIEQELRKPFLTCWYALPDLPHPALQRTLTGHTQAVYGCAISPDGEYIVSASYDHTLRVWDALTGAKRFILAGHTGEVRACVVSPTGEYIVSASHDGTLIVWDAFTGTKRLVLVGHTDGLKASGVRDCAVSPNGEYIVSASQDHTLIIWDAVTGVKRFTLRGHQSTVNGCAISPKGDFIASTSQDRTVKVWDTQTGEERLTLVGHTSSVTGCAISPTSTSIASSSWDGTLKIWDAQTGEESLSLIGHTNGVTGCVFSPTGEYLVSTSWDKTLKFWDVLTGRQYFTLTGHRDGIRGCAISPTDDFIVSSSIDRTLKVWDTHTGKEHPSSTRYIIGVRGCAISPTGDFIVTTSRSNGLQVWNIQTGAESLTIKNSLFGEMTGCAVSADGKFIASSSDDNTLIVCDAYTGERFLTLVGHTNGVNGCVFDPMGEYIYSASRDNTIKIWSAQIKGGQYTETRKESFTLIGHTDWVWACAIDPAGKFIVSASDDKTLKIWDVLTGEERLTLKGHTDGVRGCAVSPKGDFIVSASIDTTLKVWDAQTGAERLVLRGHGGWVWGCAISPDGRYIISTSDDETLRVWDAQDGSCKSILQVDNALYACTCCSDSERIIAVGEAGLYFLRLVL